MIAGVRKMHWIVRSQFGFDLKRFLLAFRRLPRFGRDWASFSKEERGAIRIRPCLHDADKESGSTKTEYFWQDLIVARMLHDRNPRLHVDIGSRIDGFVAHVASFREIEVFDVRPNSSEIPGVVFRQANLAGALSGRFAEYADSVSCLHALEHFGLGRYGDPIDAGAFESGFASISSVVAPGGTLYLSVPIGMPVVEFNAHRVSSPMEILRLGAVNGLVLSECHIISSTGGVSKLSDVDSELPRFAEEAYNLGVFEFLKPSGT